MDEADQKTLELMIERAAAKGFDAAMEKYGIKPKHFVFLVELHDRVESNRADTRKIIRRMAAPIIVSIALALLNYESVRNFLNKHF